MNLIFGTNLYYNLLFFIITSVVFTWLFTQSFKVFLKCWLGERFSLKLFLRDGDFPSAHTAVVTSGVILILFLNAVSLSLTESRAISSYNSAKDFLIMFTLASIVLRDAMGQRHRQDNTNRNLKQLKDYVKDLSDDGVINVIEHIDSTFDSIDSEAIKRVGHLKHEVYGGLIIGLLCPLYPIILFFDRYEWLIPTLIATVIYIATILTFLKLKPRVKKTISTTKEKYINIKNHIKENITREDDSTIPNDSEERKSHEKDKAKNSNIKSTKEKANTSSSLNNRPKKCKNNKNLNKKHKKKNRKKRGKKRNK